MTAVLPITAATLAHTESAFRNDVLRGLSSPQKTIPARWFYDRRGSELFEAITKLPEYYPTRTEHSILARNIENMARLIGPGYTVIEFGSGSSTKTRLLLDAISPSAYVPIDISGDFLYESCRTLAQDFPNLPIHPVVGDFTQALQLPNAARPPRLGFFPGSTIGNLMAPTAVDLLRTMSATLGTSAKLLIGIDRIKSTDTLIPAYNDAQGVTAQFNLNLLHRINRELAATIPVSSFKHVAKWNDLEARIEMHLEALHDVSFAVADQNFQMTTGETIHTENSIKYGTRDMRVLLRAGGWTPLHEWIDEAEMFSVILAEAKMPDLVP